MKILCLAVVAVLPLIWMSPAECKEKFEELTELEFQVKKMRLVGENVALMTYMGDLMDVTLREIPKPESNTVMRAISAMTHRKLVKFVIPDTRDNEETVEVFYTLAPGAGGRPGTQITIYGKLVRLSDNEVFIMVGRDSGPAIEAGWPEHRSPCPTCGRPGRPGTPRPKKGGKKSRR